MATRSDPRRKSPTRKVNRTATATRRARVVTAVAALTVVGLGVGLGLTQTGEGGAKRGSTTFLLTASGLESFAKDHGSPIYWVGPQLGADYELTSSPDGRVFLSYIPAGSRPRAQRAYVSVGAY